jgi:predicted nucleic acid-binding OB-fold protein
VYIISAIAYLTNMKSTPTSHVNRITKAPPVRMLSIGGNQSTKIVLMSAGQYVNMKKVKTKSHVALAMIVAQRIERNIPCFVRYFEKAPQINIKKTHVTVGRTKKAIVLTEPQIKLKYPLVAGRVGSPPNPNK